MSTPFLYNSNAKLKFKPIKVSPRQSLGLLGLLTEDGAGVWAGAWMVLKRAALKVLYPTWMVTPPWLCS